MPNIAEELESGRSGYIAIEAAMILPLVVLLFGAMAQFLDHTRARIVIEHAAFAAARSALVHKCKPTAFTDLLHSPLGAIIGSSCADRPQAWHDAARWALASTASVDDDATARDNCPDSPDVADSAIAAGMDRARLKALENRLCYVFEPGNVLVEVDWVHIPLTRNSLPRIRAHLRYRLPLTAPIGHWFADGIRDDGTKWRWAEARVTLS